MDKKEAKLKKSIVIGGICLLLGGFYFIWSFLSLDFSKIVFVLPSSERASSPYYYQKDGDFFLASDLCYGLEKLGYKVEYRFREDYDNLKLGNAGNVIYFKGYADFEHLPAAKKDNRKRILYVYYLEGLHPEILKEVDVVASASNRFINENLIPEGITGVYVPQFTNPERFRPAKTDEGKHNEVLFVGSDHSGFGRKCVDYAVLAESNLSVYGKFWEKSLSPEYLKGKFINNDVLYQYYGNADIVLNDHREDMRHYGFISNRIYDVTATGGFVFTDYLPEIEEIYGDSIATYKDFYDFKEKLDFYLKHPEIRKEMAEKAQKITLEKFTNVKVARIFDSIFKSIKK